MPDGFTKYRDRGAYHWKSVRGGALRRSPREDAKYSMVPRVLRARMRLEGSLGMDAGCGDGVLLYKLLRAGARVIGLDPTAEALRLAGRELSVQGVRADGLIVGDGGRMPLATGSLDFVSAVEVIEHLPDVDVFLAEVVRVLRPGGWFVCTTPNRGANPPDVVRDPFHVHEFVADELRGVLQARFEAVDVTGRIPSSLDRWYLRGRRQNLIDKVARVVFRLTAFGVANPYLLSRSPSPDGTWHMLLAAGRSKSGRSTLERTRGKTGSGSGGK